MAISSQMRRVMVGLGSSARAMIGARVVTPIRSVAVALREFQEVEMSDHIRALVTRPLSHSKVTCDTNLFYERDLSSLVK